MDSTPGEPPGGVAGRKYARLFLAFELPDAVQRSIAGAFHAIAAEQTADCSYRLVSRGMLHVTVAFLGVRPVADVLRCRKLVEETLYTARAPEARCAELVFLPAERRPRVCAVRLEGEALALLGEELRTALRSEPGGGGEALFAETRSFLPHVTVARAKRGFSKEEMRQLRARSNLPSHSFAVGGCSLFESRLSDAGAAHELLWRLEL